jgi:hypothetical protein
MWDWSFGIPGVGGLGGISLFNNQAAPAPGTVSSGSPGGGTQTTSYPPGTAWWQVLLTSGLDAYKSFLNTDTAQTQIAAGQYPSQNAIIPNLNAATGSLVSFLPVLVIIIVVIALGRFAFGGRKK